MSDPPFLVIGATAREPALPGGAPVFPRGLEKARVRATLVACGAVLNRNFAKISRLLSGLFGVSAVLVPALAGPAAAQTTGTLTGRVVAVTTGEPLAGASVSVVTPPLRTVTDENGRFILTAVPPGERTVRAELLGYRTLTVEATQIRVGINTTLNLELQVAAVGLEPLVVRADAFALIEPQVSATREVVARRELSALPIDETAQALELAPGVSDGHFRGGRIGQEIHVVDGLQVKNQLEGSVHGFGLELSPTSLEELQVLTGGFGAGAGSALSGVVNYVTRRGHPEQWQGSATATTDQWAPGTLFRGFSALSLSAGGPVPRLGPGTTLFADLLVHGMMDAEPRAHGLTCLRPEHGDPGLAGAIVDLQEDRATAHLYCPYRTRMLPNQAGDKRIAFLRLDRPLGDGAEATFTLLDNRLQRLLYTPEFKYNRRYQLGQRTGGRLGSGTLHWITHGPRGARRLTTRAAAMRLDRHLGAVDAAAFTGGLEIAGFRPGRMRFLGEDFVRLPVGAQLAAGTAVPGYLPPGGDVGSPFGPAAAGIFFTEGTPHIANWTRTDMLGADLEGELVDAHGSAIRAGASGRWYRVEAYERIHSHLPDSEPYHARFSPATATAFAEVVLLTDLDAVFQIGGRMEAFRPGMTLRVDAGDEAVAPEIETSWKISLGPRLGVAMPVPGTGGRTALRFNYGMVVQPPDFRVFLDTSIGDSLRVDIHRQGNPEVGFERAASYEVGMTHLLSDWASVGVTGFQKQLYSLATGSIALTGTAPGQFSTADFGTVQGVEVTLRAILPGVLVRGGYALQRATGVTSGLWADTVPAEETPRVEFPLAFDRRHSADLAVFAGHAAGVDAARWGVAGWTTLRSGYPLDRRIAAGDFHGPQPLPARLPWTAAANLRATLELGTPPGCARCAWRVVADGRNVTGRENLIGLRRDTGRPGPGLDVLLGYLVDVDPLMEPIPMESPRYSRGIDLDGDGRITADELRVARFAAALDRFDPSLYFADPRQLRLGLEVTF